MKTLILILFFSVLVKINAQEGPEGWPYLEIFIGTYIPGGGGYSYLMQAQGTVWKGGPLFNQPYSIATEPHFLVSRCPISGTVNHTNFSDIFSWPGFGFLRSEEYPPVPYFGYGLYKFSVNSGGGDAYFYIDYRDNQYTNYTYCDGHCADIWIKYDATVDKFYYFSKGDSAIYPLSPNWRPIHKGQYLSIWQIKNQIPQGSPQTNQFPNYWQNCLVVIPKNVNNAPRPHLVWGPYSTFQQMVCHFV